MDAAVNPTATLAGILLGVGTAWLIVRIVAHWYYSGWGRHMAEVKRRLDAIPNPGEPPRPAPAFDLAKSIKDAYSEQQHLGLSAWSRFAFIDGWVRALEPPTRERKFLGVVLPPKTWRKFIVAPDGFGWVAVIHRRKEVGAFRYDIQSRRWLARRVDGGERRFDTEDAAQQWLIGVEAA